MQAEMEMKVVSDTIGGRDCMNSLLGGHIPREKRVFLDILLEVDKYIANLRLTCDVMIVGGVGGRRLGDYTHISGDEG